jgi:hypothetical protein
VAAAAAVVVAYTNVKTAPVPVLFIQSARRNRSLSHQQQLHHHHHHHHHNNNRKKAAPG